MAWAGRVRVTVSQIFDRLVCTLPIRAARVAPPVRETVVLDATVVCAVVEPVVVVAVVVGIDVVVVVGAVVGGGGGVVVVPTVEVVPPGDPTEKSPYSCVGCASHW